MRQLRLWIDDERVGCGQRIFLEVSRGRDYAHLLYVPTLSHVRLPLREVEDQLRRCVASEIPIARGVIGRIADRRRQAERYHLRYPEAFVQDALAALRGVS